MPRRHDSLAVNGRRWRITEPTFTASFRVWVGILARVGPAGARAVTDALLQSDPETARRLADAGQDADEERRRAYALEVVRQASLGRRLSNLVLAEFPGTPDDPERRLVQDPTLLVLRWLAPHLGDADPDRLARECVELLWYASLTLFEGDDPEAKGSLWALRRANDREGWGARLDEMGIPNLEKARLAVWAFLYTSLPTSTAPATSH